MSELLSVPAPGEGAPTPQETQQALGSVIAAAVLATPGVIRLEPTITGAIRSLGGSAEKPEDHLQIDTRTGLVDVSVSVATHADHQAREVAHEVRATIARLIASAGAELGDVSVSVLSIETHDELSVPVG